MGIALLESSRRPSRGSHMFLLSIGAHVALLGVVLTRDAWTAAESLRGPEVVVLQYPRTPEPATVVRRLTSVPSNPATPTLSPQPLLPIPSLDPPPVILSVLPAPGSADPGFDEALFDRRRFADVGRQLSSDKPTSRSNDALDASMVDTPVVAKGDNPVPNYPSLLVSAGVEGSVVMNFVVDTTGAVEKQSIVVLHSSHALFEKAVRDALVRMRFTPAQMRGRKARQLVEQTFTFAIKR